MDLIVANRASAILYMFLTSRNKPGDHYLIPTNICPEVVLVFLKAGIRLTFLDLETQNLGIEPLDVRNILGKEGVNGILYNHTYGNEYIPVEFLKSLKKEIPEIYLIDDRCLCFPDPNYSDELFDLILFSTGPKKQIDLGYGGFGKVNGSQLKSKTIKIIKKDFEYVRSLIKEPPKSEKWKQAAFLDWFDAIQNNCTESYFNELARSETIQLSYKKNLKEIYYENIPHELLMDDKYNDWRVQIHVKNKKNLLEMIFKTGFFAGDHYRSLGSRFDNREFPVAESLEREVINLFIDFNIKQAKALQLSLLIKNNGNPV